MSAEIFINVFRLPFIQSRVRLYEEPGLPSCQMYSVTNIPLQVRVCRTFRVIKMFPKQMLLCVTLEDSETDLEPRGSPSWSYLLHLAVQVLGVSVCLCVHTVYMYCMSKS